MKTIIKKGGLAILAILKLDPVKAALYHAGKEAFIFLGKKMVKSTKNKWDDERMKDAEKLIRNL